MALCLVIALGIFLLIGVPIYVALSLSSVISLFFFADFSLIVVMQRMFGGIDKFALMSLPFYILAAEIMMVGGMSRRILSWVDKLLGGFRGSHALVTQTSSMFFGALSGSSPATVAAIGNLMYPELLRNGYSPSFSSGLITSSGSVALLIPPSITFIIYGATTGVSIGALFVAGVGAGLLYGSSVLVYCWLYAKRHGIQAGKKHSAAVIWMETKEASWALGVPIIILGGIFSGVFTPTEAAGVSVIYALFISFFVYKELDLKKLYETLVESSTTIGQLMLLLAGASLFGWVLTVSFVPQMLTMKLVASIESKYVFLMIINVLFLIAGMFIDGGAAIMILAPLLFKPAMQMGIDPVHLGVVLVANICVGMFSPPFGLNLFVSKTISGLPILQVFRSVIPFLLVCLVSLLLITYAPQVSLFLPRLMGY